MAERYIIKTRTVKLENGKRELDAWIKTREINENEGSSQAFVYGWEYIGQHSSIRSVHKSVREMQGRGVLA